MTDIKERTEALHLQEINVMDKVETPEGRGLIDFPLNKDGITVRYFEPFIEKGKEPKLLGQWYLSQIKLIKRPLSDITPFEHQSYLATLSYDGGTRKIDIKKSEKANNYLKHIGFYLGESDQIIYESKITDNEKKYNNN